MSICLLSDGGLPSVSCVTHYSFVRSFVPSPNPNPSPSFTLALTRTLALTLALALALTLPYQVRGGVRAAPPRQEAGHRRRGRFSQAQRSLRGALRPERALTLQVAEGAARPEREGVPSAARGAQTQRRRSVCVNCSGPVKSASEACVREPGVNLVQNSQWRNS